MNFKVTYLLAFVLLLSSFSLVKEENSSDLITLITSKKTFEAGESITLQFSTNSKLKPILYCSNSYGSTLITASLENNILNYSIPKNITNKSGLVNWKLLNKENTISGYFNIKPVNSVSTMESYLGPPSIQAGGTDYSMLVVIPTDSLDNPVKDNTLVNIKHQFLNSERIQDIKTKHLISYKNIFSPEKTGRILISSECLKTNSKEFTLNIMPAIGSNFTISAKRHHDYADGNQITTLSTSIIKDRYDNIIADGSHVSFYITTKNNTILKASGNTINGIANTKIIHPDHESYWSIKAFINGIAESNTIKLKYEPVITNFNVAFSENNRIITVGKLQSFMKQTIPDGLKVNLLVYNNEELIGTLDKYSNEGFVYFKLNNAIYKNDMYTMVIETSGVKQTFQNKKLW